MYNSLEAAVSIGAGVVAGSVALVGFGIDSMIEFTASGAAMWRLNADLDPSARARIERQSVRLIGASFLAIAGYVAYDASVSLLSRHAPEESVVGIMVAVASLIVMPLLGRAKRRVAYRLESGALAAEARQLQICAYLSAILLVGLGLNAIAGWWWADPVAALAMTPLIGWEGLQALRGRTVCRDCS
jgi:divalent metal cation (Fe/Co/Zn/Cd) transporter